MNILSILKALAGAIAAAFLAITGSGAAPQQAQIQEIASTTDAVVVETIRQAATTTPDDIQQAYELGKQVGQLQAQAQQIKSQPAPTMTTPNDTTGAVPGNVTQSTSAPDLSTPTASAPAQTPVPVASAPASLARIDVINPIAGKGVRPGISTSSDLDDRGNPSNEVIVGAVVYGADGQPTDSATVTVTTTDPSQDKTIVGTGSITPIYVDGDRRLVPVYMFTYETHQTGQNEIVFSTADASGKAAFDAK